MKFGWLLIFLFFLVFCISLSLYEDLDGFSSSPIFIFSVFNIIVSSIIVKWEEGSAQDFEGIMAFLGLVYDEELIEIEDDDDYGEIDVYFNKFDGYDSDVESDDGCSDSDDDDERENSDGDLERRVEEFIAETIKRWRKELLMDN